MTVQEMIEQLSAGKNPELYQKIAAYKTADEAYEAAKAAGLTTPKDESVAAFMKWQKQTRELSDIDLEEVAGGNGGPTTIAGEEIYGKGGVHPFIAPWA